MTCPAGDADNGRWHVCPKNQVKHRWETCVGASPGPKGPGEGWCIMCVTGQGSMSSRRSNLAGSRDRPAMKSLMATPRLLRLDTAANHGACWPPIKRRPTLKLLHLSTPVQRVSVCHHTSTATDLLW